MSSSTILNSIIFAQSSCIDLDSRKEKIVKDINQHEQIDSSTQKRKFITLEIKIKRMNLMMREKNNSKVGGICKIDPKIECWFFINLENGLI